MESKMCMNTSCGVKTTLHWKKAWELKSGQIADLCYKCGSAFDELAYCDTFHVEETGWRECSLCNKRLHCGCSASAHLIKIQDSGGVCCISCAKTAICNSAIQAKGDGVSCEAQTSVKYNNTNDEQNAQFSYNVETNNITNGNIFRLGNTRKNNVPRHLAQSPPASTNGSFEQVTPETTNSLIEVGGLGFSNLSHALNGSTHFAQPYEDTSNAGVMDMQESQMPSLNESIHSPPETSTFCLNISGGVEEGDNKRSTPFQSGKRPQQILPKLIKNNIAKDPEVNKSLLSAIRMPRPPAEEWLRSQLPLCYWPRMTDEELQQLSLDLNSKIVPLFEKILSASDASEIGRFVLPKACVEAYFPTIGRSKGLSLSAQDIKGNEWTFQLRSWLNRNGRMYVLEGVAPFIQTMQLQAGDTVTFSRTDPGEKLVIGYRKASNTDVQDPHASSSNPNGAAAGEISYTLQFTGGATEDQLNILPEQSNLVNQSSSWSKVNEDALEQPKLLSKKKRMQNISSKSKRLHMHDDDAMELRLTCKEIQDLLRPPLSVCPNITVIDNFEIEVYSDPPVIGKRTFFTIGLSGGAQQWAQCDNCSKWRKLPTDVFLPEKWECSENIWDLTRSSCSSPEEIYPKQLGNVIKGGKVAKKRRVTEPPVQGSEPSELDALPSAATLGDVDSCLLQKFNHCKKARVAATRVTY